ncbi:MAG: glucosaminidase domain-containing protein, partial [Lentisphaeraceae bacterium]|nr:glucosaminidase domain-containing protein [Lentisphaeraceae bacterium]
MGFGECSSEQMAAYILLKNTRANREVLLYLAQTYIREAKLEGVNHDIAFAQMCHETKFLKFGNQVKKNQNNYCGLGAI